MASMILRKPVAEHTAIEWTDATWNPIRGCTRVSSGCGGPGKQGGCYAEQIAARFSKPGQPFHGFAEMRNGEARWTGKLALIEDALTLPLRWRKPRKIFVNSMSDLFHEALPDSAIDRVFAVMSLCPQHTFQVLTKRPERMREYFAALARDDRALDGLGRWHAELAPLLGEAVSDEQWEAMLSQDFPLPNVWLGTSCEDQATVDERIPHLLQTPAAVRFVSLEPLLGAIDLTKIPVPDDQAGKYAGHGYTFNALQREDDLTLFNAPAHLDWVIAGGESGQRARPAHPDWFRSLQKQCEAADVPFFFKQWGEWAPIPYGEEGANPRAGFCHPGGHGAKWPSPEGLGEYGPHWLQEHGFAHVVKVGKKAAGRLLDGVEHSAFPQVRA